MRALASGDVQIGNLGSSPLAVAASQQVPIEVFLLASKLGNSEALVVKKNITKPEDLIGKRIAVPFISTTHYSLLSALKHWGIKPGQVQIINLQPPAIIAAWQRGDIDGAYVWAPAVNELEKEGKVLTDSSQVGEWGAPTLDVWVVRKDFAEQHPEIVKAFAKSAIDAQQPYIANPEAWLKQPDNISKLARLSGVPEADVPGLVKGNTYLTAAEQAQAQGVAQLVQIEAGGVQAQVSQVGNRVQQRRLIANGFGQRAVFIGQRVTPACFRKTLEQRAFLGVEKQHVDLDMSGTDFVQQLREALQMTGQVACIDRHGDLRMQQLGMHQRAFCQLRQEPGGQVVDAIEAVVFEDGQGSAFTGAGASADND